MMSASSGGLVRSTFLIGGAQFTNVAVSILRLKVIAVLLGPAGIGLLGIYTNLLEALTVLAGLGMGTSGVRQIAAIKDDVDALSQTRKVLTLSFWVQGLLALTIVWLLRNRISIELFGDSSKSTEIGYVGLGVFALMLSSTQSTLLQGLRRVTDLAWTTVFVAGLGTIVAISAVWFMREDGVIWALLSQPVIVAGVVFYFARRIPIQPNAQWHPDAWRIWRSMVAVGATFMLAGLVSSLTLLIVRAVVTRRLGLDAAGHLAASWSISIQSVGFLMSAMAVDYYPRLAEVIDKPAGVSRLINAQTQLGLAVGGPILLLLIGLAPWVMLLLYSRDFTSTTSLVQWQTAGNLFKLASIPLSFALLAAARMRAYLSSEIAWNVAFFGLLYATLPGLGLDSAGPSFLISYVLTTGLLTMLARRHLQFRWERLTVYLLAAHAIAAGALLIICANFPITGAFLSVAISFVMGVAGLRIVADQIDQRGPWARRVSILFRAVGWPR